MYEDTGLVFVADLGFSLKVGALALRKMRSFIQHRNSDPEAGGVLLGRFIRSSKNVVIDEVTVPQLDDKSSPTRFYRHQQGHQLLVEQYWKDSEGTCNYLGEWHTHPEDHPRPSGIDLQNWRRLVKNSKQQFDGLFFLIVGRKTISAHYVSGNPIKISELYAQA